ncbi:MAG: DUF3566 domain-containing protein [Acidimicrobiia bacterium]
MAKAQGDMDPRPTGPVGAVPAPDTTPDVSPDGAPKKKRPRKRATPAKTATAPKPANVGSRPAQQPPPQPRPVQPARVERRLRHTIQKVDLWSVLKLSLCFYLCSLAVVVVALVSLWAIADSFGIVENVEEFIGELLSSEDFTFLSGEMLRGVVLVGLVLVMLQVVITVIAGAFYNLFAALFGGLEITVVEEDTTAP